jgi:hypothetical protein
MKRVLQFASRSARTALSWVFSFALWTFWLGLVALLGFQLYILTANELSLPQPVLRHLERKLADSGLRATFTRTSFDPAGRILVENVGLWLPGIDQPVVTARAVYVRLNLWLLAVGTVEPREVRITDGTAFVPAMLSRSGRAEEIVQGLDATLEPTTRAISIQHLSARVADVALSARGVLPLPRSRARTDGTNAVEEFITQRFATVCRQALALRERIAQFREPSLHLELSPSESGAASIRVLALARSARLDQPVALEADGLRVTTTLLLFGDAPPSHVEFSARELRLAGATVRGVNAQILARFRTADRQFELREVAATADSATGAGIVTSGLAARIFPRPLPRLDAEAVARVFDAPLALRGEADLAARAADVRFQGEISPRVLDLVSQRARTDVRRFFDFESLTAEHASARFGPGWKFKSLDARIRVPRMMSYGVPMHDGRATVHLDPQSFRGTEAFARTGNNFARGSYEHDLETHRYRFLLEGELRPLEISEWFRDWWTNFFEQLQFPAAPPAASVDVNGVWRDGRQSHVFVFADAKQPVIRGVPFDRVRTRLFIRPAFFDGLELLATRPEGNAHGRFTYVAEPATRAWHTLELGLDSTLDLAVATQLIGPAAEKVLAPFQLEAPPRLKLRGEFAGPAAPGGEVEKLRIEARTSGGFRFHGFPLQNVSFNAALDRDEIVLEGVEATFAGGLVGGQARVSGIGAERRLGFDFALQDASLGQVAASLAEFFAAQEKREPTPPGKFVQEKANVRINLAASAEGRYDNPLSYRGSGNAVLRGAELGEVPLLGALSELFTFTALRFNEARANFRIEGPRLVFPEVTLRGANSAIDAHGTYALDRRELDFNARVFPFQESGNLIKSVVGAVLTPLSNALEVKLSGSVEKPQWAFVMGPTNLLRSLSGANDKVDSPAGDQPAAGEAATSPAARLSPPAGG